MTQSSFVVKLPLNVTFAVEEFTPVLFQEMLPLLSQHWLEVAHYQDIPLNPNLAFYMENQRQGSLRCFTVRKAGELIGYAVFFVRYNAHYHTSLQAFQDVVFLHPDSRGTIALKFLKFCDSELQKENVQAVYHHVKAAHNFGLVLQRMGYELVDLIYARRLDQKKES